MENEAGNRPRTIWSKYNRKKNLKSPRPPNGKEGSAYYSYLVIAFGEEQAIIMYREFKYQLKQGQKETLDK